MPASAEAVGKTRARIHEAATRQGYHGTGLRQSFRNCARREIAADVDPIAGLMTATLTDFYVFNIERIFGVKRLYGTSDSEAIGEIANLLRRGLEPR